MVFRYLSENPEHFIWGSGVVNIQIVVLWAVRVCVERYKSWWQKQQVQLKVWYLFTQVHGMHSRRLIFTDLHNFELHSLLGQARLYAIQKQTFHDHSIISRSTMLGVAVRICNDTHNKQENYSVLIADTFCPWRMLLCCQQTFQSFLYITLL
jgi:hypothetical protein